jgi:hypothetical protein
MQHDGLSRLSGHCYRQVSGEILRQDDWHCHHDVLGVWTPLHHRTFSLQLANPGSMSVIGVRTSF